MLDSPARTRAFLGVKFNPSSRGSSRIHRNALEWRRSAFICRAPLWKSTTALARQRISSGSPSCANWTFPLMSKEAKSQWEFGDLFSQPTTRRVLSVSQLTANVRSLLEKQLGQVWVSGELSN